MALTRRTRKRLLFLAVLLAGAGLVVAGYYLVIIPRREYRARVAWEQAQKAYAASDYDGVLKTVGIYLGRNRYDGEALYITADSHFRVSLACAARGDSEGWMKNYRGARDYAMAARAQLGNDPRPLELLLILHTAFREIAEVEEIASILGESSQPGMEAYTHAAIWAGNNREALRRAERYVEAWPDDTGARRLLHRCMIQAGRDIREVRDVAAQASDGHPGNAEFAALYASAAVDVATLQGASASGEQAEADLALAMAALERIARAVPVESETFAEYLLLVDQILCSRALDSSQRQALDTQRREVIDRLMAHPERRQWAAATAAAWAWSRTGRTADVAPFLEPVADIPDDEADVTLLGWRGACASVESRRDQIIAELGTKDTALAQLWRYTLSAIAARLADDQGAYQENLDRGIAISETSATWLPFFEMELALSQSRKNDRAGAIRLLRQIVERAPVLVAPRISLYHHLLQDGRTEDALTQAGLIRHLRFDDAESMYLWLVAAITAAEEGSPIEFGRSLEWLANQAALEKRVEDRPNGWQNLATLVARAHLIRGQREQAGAIIDEVSLAQVQVEPAFLVAVMEACKRHKLEVQAAKLAATQTHNSTPDVLLTTAELVAGTQGTEAARQGLLERIRAGSGDERLSARIAYVSFLDERDQDAARAAVAELLDEHADSVVALTHALGTSSIWTDHELVTRALASLKKFGEDEPGYRIFNANRFIVFEYDPAGAADQIQAIDGILKRDPENVRALRMMAILLLKSGDGVPSSAINYMQQAAQLGHLESRFDLVKLLLDAGRPDEARRAADSLRSIARPTPAMLRARAGVWFKLGMLGAAEGDLAALGDEATPRDVAERAMLLADLGRSQQALQLAEQVVQHGTEDAEVLRRAASVFAALGEAGRGRQLLQEQADRSGEEAARLALADYLMAVGEAAEAASIYQHVVQSTDEARPELWLRLADCYVRAGQRELACQALAEGPDDPAIEAARLICSRPATGTAAVQVLSRWLESLIRRDSRDLAITLAGGMTTEQEVAAFANANRSFLLGWLELAHLRMAAGDTDGAIEAMRSAVYHIPLDPLPPMLLTVNLVAAGRWDDAAVAIDEWSKRDGQSPMLHIYAALIAEHRQNWEAIVELLEPHRQRLIESTDPSYAAVLATGLAGTGRADEAHELLWPLVESKRLEASVYAAVAARAHEHMRLRELQRWTERVEPILPADDDALIRLKFALALALDGEGQVDAAEPLYRAVLASKSPELRPAAANNLAEILRRQRRDLDEAIELAQSAVDAADAAIRSFPSAPSHLQELLAACLDTLGLCQLANGRVSDAVVTFEKAFAASPQKVNIRAGLIVSLEKAGRSEDAERYLSEGVRRLGPSLEDRVKELRAEYGPKKAAAAGTP